MAKIVVKVREVVLFRAFQYKTRARQLLMMLSVVASSAAVGQMDSVHRQKLETASFPSKRLHTSMMRTTLDAGGLIAPHRHPGLEVAYVAAGQVKVAIGDAPERTVAAGGSFQIARGVRHKVANTSAMAAVIVSTYIVDPAQPMASPAP
jgi:quercetin dioxygenase-like cupin family protein